MGDAQRPSFFSPLAGPGPEGLFAARGREALRGPAPVRLSPA